MAASSRGRQLPMTPHEKMERIELLISHIWMVRAFLKHSDEAQDDEELQQVQRDLYDTMLALGEPYKSGDAEGYLRKVKKKLTKLKAAARLFAEIQPEVSTHTNFVMASRSLTTAVRDVIQLI